MQVVSLIWPLVIIFAIALLLIYSLRRRQRGQTNGRGLTAAFVGLAALALVLAVLTAFVH